LAEWEARDVPVIFQGKVEKITLEGWPPKPIPGQIWTFPPHLRISFENVQVYRGAQQPKMVIETGLGFGDCGYPFVEAKSYLVFAHSNEDHSLATGICTGTSPLSAADSETRFLRGEGPTIEDNKGWQATAEASSKQLPELCGKISLPTGKHPDLTVYYEKLSTDQAMRAVDETTPADDGSFCFSDPRPGKFIVFALETEPTHPSYRYLSFYPGTTVRSKAKAVTFDGTTSVNHIDFPLERQKLFSVSGQIAGQFANGIQVALLSSAIDMVQIADSADVQPNGAFRFEGVPPGPHTLFVFIGEEPLTFLSRGVEVEVSGNISDLTVQVVTTPK
jgi:hypothetical protein